MYNKLPMFFLLSFCIHAQESGFKEKEDFFKYSKKCDSEKAVSNRVKNPKGNLKAPTSRYIVLVANEACLIMQFKKELNKADPLFCNKKESRLRCFNRMFGQYRERKFLSVNGLPLISAVQMELITKATDTTKKRFGGKSSESKIAALAGVYEILKTTTQIYFYIDQSKSIAQEYPAISPYKKNEVPEELWNSFGEKTSFLSDKDLKMKYPDIEIDRLELAKIIQVEMEIKTKLKAKMADVYQNLKESIDNKISKLLSENPDAKLKKSLDRIFPKISALPKTLGPTK